MLHHIEATRPGAAVYSGRLLESIPGTPGWKEAGGWRIRLILVGRVAVVTGAGRGVGRSISMALAAHGATVALVARGAGQLEETRQAIIAAGGSASSFAVDVTQPDAVLEHLRADVLETLGQPAILVNSAGTYGPVALLKDSDPGHWIRTLEVNTIGAYLLCRAFVGGMIERGWGRDHQC